MRGLSGVVWVRGGLQLVPVGNWLRRDGMEEAAAVGLAHTLLALFRGGSKVGAVCQKNNGSQNSPEN
jgi:uncharacterized membrane protein YfcA